MSSESHHVFCTRNVAVLAESRIAATTHTDFLRPFAMVAAKKYAYGTARMAIHLHGNCTNLSFGRCAQKKALGRIIKITATAERTSSTRQSFFVSSRDCS